MAGARKALPGGVEGVEVIVGTYEEFVLGYKLAIDKENERYSLSMSFTNHSQIKSIRALTTVGKYIAAGSADESINLINMDSRVEHGRLQEQNGTITCLADHNGCYLFSGCEDGTVCIWKKGSWMCEKTLRAHTGGVVDVSVHPSGKLALSIGKDKALKTWNLVKGRCGYVTNLKTVADVVRWSTEGGYYAIGLTNRVDVYSLQTAKVVYSIDFGKRISCISFIDENTIIVGGDKESVEIHDLKRNKKLTEFSCHKVRVRAVQYVPELKMLFTGSNDGFIKVWSFKKDKYTNSPELLAEIDTTCRITCMTVWVKQSTTLDTKEEDMEVEEEEEVEDDDADSDEEESELGSEEEETDEEVDDEEMSSDDSSESEEDTQMARKRQKVEKKGKVNNSPKEKEKSKPKKIQNLQPIANKKRKHKS